MSLHTVEVGPLPPWLDAPRLLGPGDLTLSATEPRTATLQLDTAAAADLAARLRGLGLAGQALEVRIDPPLPRSAVRAARTVDARRRWESSPGFSKADVRIDEEGRFSLTPEALALAMGRRAGKGTVLDAGCGAGGNTIGFARAGCTVLAVEANAARLAMARHNARLYGVAARCQFEVGDAVEWAQRAQASLLFVDPPWGQDWSRTCTRLADLPLLAALLPLRGRFERFWIKAPSSFDTSELPAARVTPFFGVGEGDRQRIKFLLIELIN